MLRQLEHILLKTKTKNIFKHRTMLVEMLTVLVASPCPQHNGAPIIVPGPDILFI